MALTKLNYTKNWESAEDFPTYEGDEAKVRSDMQLLFDEMKTAFNNLIDELKAAEIPFSATAEIEAATVQAAIENVQDQIAGIVVGQLQPNSVSTPTLVDGAVTLAKLGDDVTPAGLGAAVANHDHDGRYYTEAEADARIAGLQPRTSMLAQMEDAVVDNDTFPMYDLSVAEGRKLTWARFKAALKAYFDTVYGTLLNAHASRHAADGEDPITVSTGNLADDCVTGPKIAENAVAAEHIASEAVSKMYSASISASWVSKYTYAATVEGLTEGEEIEISSSGYTLRCNTSADDTLDITLLGTKPSDAITVKLVSHVAHAGWSIEDLSAGTYSTTISVAATDWVGDVAPYLQEISVPGLLATDNPIIDIVSSDTYADAQAQMDAWAEIYKMTAGNGTLTVYANSATETAIPIQILCVRK